MLLQLKGTHKSYILDTIYIFAQILQITKNYKIQTDVASFCESNLKGIVKKKNFTKTSLILVGLSRHVNHDLQVLIIKLHL